jgi:type IV pilus assembly protein PilB
MGGAQLETFRDLIGRPEGIILVTGPTGSGKTSTLYASLAELAEAGKNVITIEDPVEYWLQGINQGQANPKAGFTFAKGLRAILRQDPDVIMVGEIRDPETLETAIEASLTGHLVLSTLHTNGSVATLTRLLEMGVEPYLIASSVAGIVAQRLVRRTCESCRQPVPVPEKSRHLFGDTVPETLFRGSGCTECRGIGYKGRIGVYEMLTLNAELRKLLNARASEDEILAAARAAGLSTLRQQALDLVRKGTTTLEEVTRVFHDLA